VPPTPAGPTPRGRRRGAPRPPGPPPALLPVPAAPIIGRAQEVRRLATWLRSPDVRLVTLTGPPGVGKTRLALAAAAAVEGDFESGVVFVNLAPIRDAELFEHTLIHTLGFRRFLTRPPLERLTAHLRERQVLLLLDNFEQVTPAGASVGVLLESCPRLRVLVTSREALRLRAEREYPVHPLAVPEATDASAPSLARAPSVTLFVARGRSVHPEFAPAGDDLAAVAEICRRLDGLPLAIELAAARIKVLPPQAILTRLSQRLPLLVAGSRDLPGRHQTLRAAIAWSEDLLEEEERTVFRRLAVFSDGFTLDAAAAVATSDLSVDALTVITGLSNKSLLRHEASARPEPRFAMLETIREYAWEHLAASGEAERIRDRHLEYYVALAERAKALFRTPQAPAWFGAVEQEYENFRAVMRWASERAHVDAELRLASAICRFWSFRGNVGEGYKWVDAALAKSDGAPPGIRAELLHDVATFTYDDEARKTALEDEALALARSLGDEETLLRGLMNRGAALHRKDPQAARAHLTEALVLAQRGEDRLRIGLLLQAFALLAEAGGDFVRAARLYGAAEVTLEAYVPPYVPHAVADQTTLGRSIVTVLREMGQEAFGAAWAEGRRMPAALAVDYALERVALPAAAAPAAGRRSEAGALTSREWEVARRITEGLSNREIGRALSISERTVDAHVQHILNKLGFSSRTQVAAWVAVSGTQPSASGRTSSTT